MNYVHVNQISILFIVQPISFAFSLICGISHYFLYYKFEYFHLINGVFFCFSFSFPYSCAYFALVVLLLWTRTIFTVTNMLLAFSLPRNWYKLTTEAQNSELSRDLRSINCFRTICMFGVICAHCALANNMVPQLNPYFIEEVCMQQKNGRKRDGERERETT